MAASPTKRTPRRNEPVPRSAHRSAPRSASKIRSPSRSAPRSTSKTPKARSKSPKRATRSSSRIRTAAPSKTTQRVSNSSWWMGEDDLNRLGDYHYRSEDDSILTRLFLNRFWTWLSHFVPAWLAPNAITLLGLAHVISSFLLSCWYRPTMRGEMPAWAYVWMGWSIFAYTTLDALDGKQARRTRSSSPLGELFDHGCDCCNLVLLSFITLAIVDIPLSYDSVAAICSAMVGFYVATWEEYHTGVLYLGHFSGPVEGAMTISVIALVSAVQVFDRLLGELFIGITAFFSFITVMQSFWHVGGKKHLVKPVLQLIPLIATLTLMPWLSKQHPIMLQGSTAFWTLLMAGTIFTNQTSLIIMHHLTKQPYPWLGLAPLTILPLLLFKPTHQLIMSLALFNAALFLCRFTVVVRQFARHLNIRVLHLKTK